MTRPTRDEWAMGLARLTAGRSTCLRRAVGCVLLNERGHVLATGYNGVAAGQPHCNEPTGEAPNPSLRVAVGVYRAAEHWERSMVPLYANACSGAEAPSGQNLDGCQAIHAEQNALLQCRDVYDIHTAYVTASPCVTCVKLLLNTGCQRIVYDEPYPHGSSELIWVRAGRIWASYQDLPQRQ